MPMDRDQDLGHVDDGANGLAAPESAVGMAGPQHEVYQNLRPWYALGARMCGRQVIEFVNENVVAYPVGHHLSLFHTEHRTMEFLYPTQSVQSIQCFHVASNRELVVVIEVHHPSAIAGASVGPGGGAGGGIASTGASAAASSSPAKPLAIAGAGHLRDQHQAQLQHFLAIYKLSTRSRMRMIPLPHNSSVVSCCLSSDNKFLALLEDAPAHNVTYWKVSTGKLIASSKCPSRGSRIFFSPNNPNYISVSGPMILKYWHWTNNEFKIGNFLPQARDQDHFVDHLWLREHMIAVSERGMLLCFRSTPDNSGVDLVHASRCHQPSYVRLECLASYAKGFVLGGSAGFFSLYESSDDPKDPFAFVRTVAVGDVAFECLAISSNLETVVACTKSQELLTLSMGAVDTAQEDRVDYRELLRHGNQLGGVLQVDTCLQRQIVVSCGIDKTVRVWNYDLRQYEVFHQCADEPVAVGLHPTGFQVLVTFKERIRLFHILHESLRQIREVPIKSCRAVKFSTGGHLFACAAGLTVNVVRTYTCETLYTFSGHIGAVKSLAWTKDDFFLYSAAHDGSLYRWSMATGSRCEDVQHLVKHCQYAAVVADERDPKTAFAAGSDGKIRELYGGEETHIVDLPGGWHVTALALTRDSKRLLAGTNLGAILVVTLPLVPKHCVHECFAHAEAITHMRLTEDNEHLLTCSEDGSISLFKVVVGANGGVALHAQVQHHLGGDGGMGSSHSVGELGRLLDRKKPASSITDSLLVAREDLEEQRATIIEMQQRYDQVKADVEFALHRKENEWIDRLRVIKDEAEGLMVQERMRYEELEHRHQQAQRKHAEDMAHKEASHVKMTQELENQYERKLAQELARYDALSETLEQTRQRCEALIEAQDTQHRNTLHAERKAAYARTKDQNDVIKRLHEDLRYNHVKFEEVLHQEETDYEQELQHLREDYERQLELERQNTAVKQGQLSAANTKLESLKKKMQELKAASHARDVLLATERAKLGRLEGTLAQYERHFDACKFSMADKDKEITGLQANNRILDNFRSVLHYRIDNLEAAKQPMQTHMSTLEGHIHDMQNELADEYQLKAQIQQDVEHKDAKIRMLLHEVKMLRQHMLKKEYSMSEMVREFTRLAQLTNSKDIDAAIKDAYKVFVMGEAVHKKPPRALTTPPVAVASGTSASSPPRPSPAKPSMTAAPATSPAKAGNKPPPLASPQQSKKQQQQHAATHNNNNNNTKSTGPSTATRNANPTSAPVTDESLGYDCKQAVDESVKQMEYMSKTITTLRTALDNTKSKADRIRRDAVAEGSILIEECNKLRKENKSHLIRIRELEHQLQQSRGGGLGGSGGGANVRDESSSASAPSPKLRASASCPQLPGSPTPHDPDDGKSSLPLVLEIGTSPGKLMPTLSRGGASPGPPRPVKSQGRPRTQQGHQHHGLPFARLEVDRGRARSQQADEELISRQRREIQRLQRQVQLLLTDPSLAAEPHEDPDTLVALSSPGPSPGPGLSPLSSLPLSPLASPSPSSSRTRAGGSHGHSGSRSSPLGLGLGLRPISGGAMGVQPLHSSFVLRPEDPPPS